MLQAAKQPYPGSKPPDGDDTRPSRNPTGVKESNNGYSDQHVSVSFQGITLDGPNPIPSQVLLSKHSAGDCENLVNNLIPHGFPAL